jgi:uncharacterized membrane protein YdcZ (DUF606 family)
VFTNTIIMITLKQVEKDERWAWKSLSNLANDHPFFTYIGGSIAAIFVFMSVTIIMMLAAVGGGAIETKSKEMLASGEITIYQYNTNMWVVDVAAWHYNFISTLIDFAVGAIIVILLYKIFKEYLKYNKENL